MKIIDKFNEAKRLPFYLQYSELIEKEGVSGLNNKYRDVDPDNKYSLPFIELVYPPLPINLRCIRL
jgi:hypothetical protein